MKPHLLILFDIFLCLFVIADFIDLELYILFRIINLMLVMLNLSQFIRLICDLDL